MKFHEIIEGSVLARGNSNFLLVKSDRKTFTGKVAYGLVHLETGVYNSIDVSLETMEGILRQTKLMKVANSLESFYRMRVTNVQ